MSEPTYIDGAEVHVGDRVDHAGRRATVVLVTERGESSPGFTLTEWAGQGNILIRQDDGTLFMYDYLNDEEDVVLLGREDNKHEHAG